jgi:hypothetical protein
MNSRAQVSTTYKILTSPGVHNLVKKGLSKLPSWSEPYSDRQGYNSEHGQLKKEIENSEEHGIACAVERLRAGGQLPILIISDEEITGVHITLKLARLT